MKNTKETSVTIVLGDEDPGDELVVDLFYDKTYGTVVFETIAGRTKCPQELGTLPQEDPGIEISVFPSEFVFPDDEMVFELELKNLGVGPESAFALYAQLKDNEGNLELKVDGASFSDSRVYFAVASGMSYKKTFTIKKGPRMFINKPIPLTFESGCMDDAGLKNYLTVALSGSLDEVPAGLPDSTVGNSMTINLYNTLDVDGNKIIKFVEPCPKISWAGPLSRDRKFLVNTKSIGDQLVNLKVTIYNPKFGTSTLSSKASDKSDRLEHVFLKYRRLGEGEADWLTALINLEDGAVAVDFVDPTTHAKEDAYGYTTLDWYHGGFEGKYEIMVESKCDALGGPEDIDSYRESIVSGVIDVTKPEKYGDPLPLRDEILLGEEVAIVFTEPLDCGRPFSFDIEVNVFDTTSSFDNDNLHLICEGRKIAFILDPGTILEPDLFMGKTFSVTLGSINNKSRAVKDLNGNEMDFNVYFERSFANLDLSEASTSFDFTLQNMPCVDATVASTSDTIKDEIAAILDLADAERISILDLNCHGSKNEVIATVEILASPRGGRRMKRTLHPADMKRAHELYRALQAGVGEERAMTGRRLGANNYSVAKMKIIPSQSDSERFKTRAENIDRERDLYRVASLLHEHTSEISEVMTREFGNEQRKAKKDIKVAIQNFEESHAEEKREELDAFHRMEEEMETMLHRMEEEKTKDSESMRMVSGVLMAICSFVAGGFVVYLLRR